MEADKRQDALEVIAVALVDRWPVIDCINCLTAIVGADAAVKAVNHAIAVWKGVK